jgi:hypothetical protein
VELNAAVRAALAGEKSVVVIGPPAWWAVLPLLAQLQTPPPLHTIVLAPESATADEGTAALQATGLLQPIHAGTGFARTARLVEAGVVGTLVTTPPDLVQLVQRSMLDLPAVRRLILCWPERHLTLGLSPTLDTILAEARGAQRVLLTGDAAPLADFLERHARRAPHQVVAEPPRDPQLTIRYAVTAHGRVFETVRAALDVLNPATALLWEPLPARLSWWRDAIRDPWVRVDADPGSDPVDLALAVDLPSAEVLAALAAVGKTVMVLPRAPQLPYLRSLVRQMRPLRLPSEADRAHERMAGVREDLRHRMQEGMLDAELLSLAPLFDEYDPALVAAAMAARSGDVGAATSSSEPAVPTWARIRISGGRRDRMRPGDVVGALINAVGLGKQQLGRVDIRETFSLIEVQAEVLQKALAGLDGLVVRGRKLAARIDQR